MELRHYTSRTNIGQIKQIGLVPSSSFAHFFEKSTALLRDMSPAVKEMVRNRNLFTYAMEYPVRDGWTETKWLDILLEHITLRGRSGVIAIDFSIKESPEVLVRDHAILNRDPKIVLHPEKARANRLEYLNSTVRITDYGGEYRAPEIIVPHVIPISELRFVELPPRQLAS